MSTSPESGSPEMGLDLDLHFLPAWAQKPTENQYAKYEGREERSDRGRGDRRDRRPGPGGGGGGRPQGRPPGQGGPGQGPRGDRGPNRDAGRPQFQDRNRRP